MRFEMAPLEGITTCIYRNAHAKYYGKMDKYYTPFLSLHKEKEFGHKELNEILPEHNEGLLVVPQVLTNRSEDFLRAADKLKKMGYEEVNINLGCPSGTVTAKGKGAGMLTDLEVLDSFLEKIFDQTPVAVSVKTRLGVNDAEEWNELLEVYRKYPLKELIVHARVRQDFYGNSVNWEAFGKAFQKSDISVCYNGDVFTCEDYKNLTAAFPMLDNVMLGRGLIADPALLEKIRNAQSGSRLGNEKNNKLEKERFKAFHDELYSGYQRIQSGEKNVLFRMKECWNYMIRFFENGEKYAKKIRKANSCAEYERVIAQLLNEFT